MIHVGGLDVSYGVTKCYGDTLPHLKTGGSLTLKLLSLLYVHRNARRKCAGHRKKFEWRGVFTTRYYGAIDADILVL